MQLSAQHSQCPNQVFRLQAAERGTMSPAKAAKPSGDSGGDLLEVSESGGCRPESSEARAGVALVASFGGYTGGGSLQFHSITLRYCQ